MNTKTNILLLASALLAACSGNSNPIATVEPELPIGPLIITEELKIVPPVSEEEIINVLPECVEEDSISGAITFC